jgi:hypothetical protein
LIRRVAQGHLGRDIRATRARIGGFRRSRGSDLVFRASDAPVRDDVRQRGGGHRRATYPNGARPKPGTRTLGRCVTVRGACGRARAAFAPARRFSRQFPRQVGLDRSLTGVPNPWPAQQAGSLPIRTKAPLPPQRGLRRFSDGSPPSSGLVTSRDG